MADYAARHVGAACLPSDSAHTAAHKLLSLHDVLARMPVSRARLYQLVKDGQFPKQVKIGSRSCWVEREVEAYIASLVERRDAA